MSRSSRCLIVALTTMMLSSAHCQVQVPMLSAHWGNLEGEWSFRTDPDDVGEEAGWANGVLEEGKWRKIHAPGYWEPQGVTDPRPGQPPKPKDKMPWTDYDGVAWYRLDFTAPAEWAGQELVLVLGSVDDYDRVFLNGRVVGETPLGTPNAVHLQRRYTIAPEVLRPGEQNTLAIKVTDGGGPGGLMGPLLSLLPRKTAEALMQLPQADRPLAERFADPPACARILKIVHGLPDDPNSQDVLIASLIAQGFGGMVCNVSFTDYLESEAKWQAFVRAVGQAKKAGMSLWLYDERGYPSGTAGGITLRDHPEWEARGLLVAEAEISGGRVELALPPGELVLAAAYPVAEGRLDLKGAVDLSAQVRDGRLTWTAPPRAWQLLVITQDRLYENTHAALSLADKLPYINLLMAEPTARFIEVTHGAYAKHLGDDLGRWFVATFTDEPSLMSVFMRPANYRVLPWSPGFPDEFRKRRGYDLRPLLPAVVTDVGGDERRIRYDFWLTVAELVSENFFGQIQDWCQAHNILSGGHLLIEESLAAHVPYYGDFFRCVRRLDAPGIDCLTSLPPQVPWYIARLISSAADLDGKTVTMCETSDHVQRYRPPGDTRPVRQVTEEEIRGACNRLILGGINTITSYYSFKGLDTEALVRLNEWVGRCCTMLTGGHQVTDLALLYPIESLWPRQKPARHGPNDSPDIGRIEARFREATETLYNARRDFTYVDSLTLGEAKVRDGALVHRDLHWRVVILPGADTLPLAAWENLAEFWRQGGVVVSLGALPTNSEAEFPSPSVQALAAEMFGTGEGSRVKASESGGAAIFFAAGSEALLPVMLDKLLEPDVVAANDGSPLRVTHRRIDGHEVYFIINDSGESCSDTVSVAAEGPGELWDPATGKNSPLAGPRNIKLVLEPYSGVLLRFARAAPPRRLPVESGGLPGLTITPLPACEPKPGKGEFVEATVESDVARSQADAPAWRAVGRLTKSDVDTFLFLTFDYDPPLDLSDAECLAVDSWVPAGQKTRTDLLIIVRDVSGGEYIATTGRPMSVSGHNRALVPFSAFRLAGWSKDQDGRLDKDGITSVRVGWGGYYGKEGEAVEFSVALPAAGKLAR